MTACRVKASTVSSDTESGRAVTSEFILGYASVAMRTSSRVLPDPVSGHRTSAWERAIQVAVVILGLVAVTVAAFVLMPPQTPVRGSSGVATGGHGGRIATGSVGAANRHLSPAGAGSQAAANGNARSIARARCGSDATTILQRLISSTANGGVVSLVAGRCYDVEGTLLVDSRSNLTIDGHGATLRSFTTGTRERMFIKVRASTGIVLRNLTLWGSNAAGVYNSDLEAQHGVGVLGDRNMTIDHITVKEVYGDGVTLTKAGGGSRAPADGVTIRNSTFLTIGRQGISPVFASNVLITGNYFDRIARTVIDMEPDTDAYVIQNITIENNRSGRYGHMFVGGGGRGCNTSHIVIRNNDSDGGSIAFGVPDTTCHKRDILVEGNTFRLATGSAKSSWAYFWRVDDVTIRNNRILTTRSLPGVQFLEAGGTLVVTGNTFSGTCEVFVANQSAPVDASANITASPCPPPPKAS